MMEFEFLVYRELLREALFRLWNFLLLTLGLGSETPNVSCSNASSYRGASNDSCISSLSGNFCMSLNTEERSVRRAG